MTGTTQSAHTLHFGMFEFDPRAGELRKHGMKIKIQGQPVEILAMLLACPGEVVTREDLRAKLWPADTFVDFEHSLNAAVNRLREALGDSADNPRFIETLPRRGYRFIAQVDVSGTAAPMSGRLRVTTDSFTRRAESLLVEAEVEAHRSRARWRVWTVAAAITAVAVAAVVAALNVGDWRDRLLRRLSPPPVRSVAVLPLENLSNSSEEEYFADGMTDELITELGQISALRVISRTSVMQYKGTRKSLQDIARELQVDALVEGSVSRIGDRVRVTASLIQASPEKHLWAESYDRDLRDVLAMQSEVARDIAREIRVKLTPRQQESLANAHVVNSEAYQHYLQGLFQLKKATLMDMLTGMQYFQRAIEEDPGYAPPYVGLSRCYGFLGFIGALPPREAYPKAKATAVKALELDETLGKAHSSLGLVKYLFDWDFHGAEREFKRAIELNPSDADAHRGYGLYLKAVARLDEAQEEYRRARQLDPLSLAISADSAWVPYFARQYDLAIDQFQRTLELEPSFVWARYGLGLAYTQKGMFEEAIAEFRKAASIEEGGSPFVLAYLAYAYAVSGKKGEALDMIDDLKKRSSRRYVSSFHIALVYTGLGQEEQAFTWLEKAYEERSSWLVSLKVEPMLDPLRSDPRFADLLRRIGLPP